jgi:hypothetical protein
MSKRSLIVLSVAALAACNGTDSNPAGVDPAFDQAVVSTDFFGEWEGSVTVFLYRSVDFPDTLEDDLGNTIFYRMERE